MKHLNLDRFNTRNTRRRNRITAIADAALAVLIAAFCGFMVYGF